MSQIVVKNLTFSYDDSFGNIFDNVSFTLDTDWRLGFTGRNGRGKTTFLNLLLGKFEYKGSISKTVKMVYFPYKVEDESLNTLTIVEELYPMLEYWKIVKELNKLQVDEEVLYRSFESLSEGEKTKVLIAMLFLKENAFLLIDEPTNHLDEMGRKIVANYLSTKKGFILVSHDRQFLDDAVDHILSINKTNIEIQQGTFTSWYTNKQLQDSFELAQNTKLKKEIKRLDAASKEKAGWSDEIEASKIGTHVGDRGAVGARAARMMKRAKSIEKRMHENIDSKKNLLKNIEEMEALKIASMSHHQKTLVFFDDVSMKYQDTTVFENLSFEIKQGECVCLKGKNGAGKSTIIKLIMDDLCHEGEISLASHLKISYVSQKTDHLCGTLSAYAKEHGIDESLFKSILRKLDFSRDQFEKNMEQYSAGQKKKVLIARSLCESAHLYIWDEPLNYIDVFSRIQIEELIINHKPTMLIVEHDAAFIKKIEARVINL